MWDRQGVLRGECSCGDCQEFMAGASIRCEYCDCVPTMHKKVDKPNNTKDYSAQTLNSFPGENSSSFLHKCSHCSKVFKNQFSRRHHEKQTHKVRPVSGCVFNGDGYIVSDSQVKRELTDDNQKPTVDNQEPTNDDQEPPDDGTERTNDEKSDDETGNITEAKRPITCLTCNRSFKDFRSRNRHMKYSHSGCVYACPLCSKTFKSKSSLKKHTLLKHTGLGVGDDYSVQKPKEEYHDPDWDVNTDIEEEVDESRGDPDLPGATTSSLDNTNHDNALQEKCSVETDAEFSGDKFDLGNVKLELVSNVEPNPVTKKQHRNTSRKRKTSKRVTVKEKTTTQQETTMKDVPCTECDKIFPSPQQMKRHKSTVHTNEFACQYCGKIFKRRYELTDHEQRHTGIRPFSCDTCGKSFFSKHNLRTHEHLHRTKGSFQCQYCGRYFDSKGGMQYHERTHTGERPYACSYCDKKFGHKSMLICHERIHTGEKPYSCCYCPKSFRDHSTLRKHIRIHTLEKPYKCDICDKAYNQRWCLRVHAKQHLADGSLAPRQTRPRKAAGAKNKEVLVSNVVDCILPEGERHQLENPPGIVQTSDNIGCTVEKGHRKSCDYEKTVECREKYRCNVNETQLQVAPSGGECNNYVHSSNVLNNNFGTNLTFYSSNLPHVVPVYGPEMTASQVLGVHKGFHTPV